MPRNQRSIENLGRRIADQRAKLGWTQQELAHRVAISRVAVSHIEAGLSDPGERTIALMASAFKIEPDVLVDGTGYPQARAERLPGIVARYTEVEMQLLLFESDRAWLDHVSTHYARTVLDGWQARFGLLLETTRDPRERESLRAALAQLQRLKTGLG
jgi:transcriptional regulator with XRE-family HTH domain